MTTTHEPLSEWAIFLSRHVPETLKPLLQYAVCHRFGYQGVSITTHRSLSATESTQLHEALRAYFGYPMHLTMGVSDAILSNETRQAAQAPTGT